MADYETNKKINQLDEAVVTDDSYFPIGDTDGKLKQAKRTELGLASESSLNNHTGNKDNPHEVTKEQVGLGNVDNTSDQNKPISDDTQEALDLKADLENGKVPTSQLPSYVDEVVEVATFTALPETGDSGKIYVTIDTNKTYRWGGTVYVEITGSITLGETAQTAYRGDRGKTAYDHSQETGNPHDTEIEDITDLEERLENAETQADYRSKISGSDSTPDYLIFKLKAGDGIELDVGEGIDDIPITDYVAGYDFTENLNDRIGINNGQFQHDIYNVGSNSAVIEEGLVMQGNISTGLNHRAGTDAIEFGRSTGDYRKIGQSFICPSDYELFSILWFRFASSIGTIGSTQVKISICSDNAGAPSTVLISKSGVPSTFTTIKDYFWTFTQTALTGGAKYWLTWESVTPSDANHFRLYYDASGTYGELKQFNGTSWVTVAGTLYFELMSQDAVELNNNISLSPLSFSVFWRMKTTNGLVQNLFSAGKEGSSGYISFRGNGDTFAQGSQGYNEIIFESRTNNEDNIYLSTGIIINDGVEHSYGLSSDSTGFYLYVDGRLADSGAPLSDTALQIFRYIGIMGRSPNASYGFPFEGTLRDVIFFNKPLTAPQFLTLSEGESLTYQTMIINSTEPQWNTEKSGYFKKNTDTLDSISAGATNKHLTATLKSNYDSAYSHISNKSNPHEVSKSQIGLSDVDNTSDADKPISEATQSALDDKLETESDPVFTSSDFGNKSVVTEIGSPASNDNIPTEKAVKDALTSVLIYKGTWNATTNIPIISDITGVSGWFYIVSVAGTQNLGSGSISFDIGDWVIHNGTKWEKTSNAGAISTDAPADGKTYGRKDSNWSEVTATQYGYISFIVGNGIDLIVNNTRGYAPQIPYAGTIVGWSITEVSEIPISSSIAVDIWKDTTGNYPPTVADSIAGTEKPLLSNQTNNKNDTIASWTKTIAVGDCIGFNIDSNTNAKKILVLIKILKS